MHLVLSRPSPVSDSVNDNLWSEEIVATPFRNIGALALVPLFAAEGVGPAEMIEVGDIIGEENEIWIVYTVVDFRDVGRARLAPLGL